MKGREAMNAPVDFKAIEGMFQREYKQIEVRFDPEQAVAWTYMKPTGAPCFNFGMLEERRARMGLPEILFNLFPGMGAYSLLGRRVGIKRAEEMIFSGRIYTAAELHEMGVVDVLAEDGLGEAAVDDYICRNERRRNATQAVFSCRQHLNPISYDELLNITNIWVDAALRLEDRDLKLMSRLGRSQLKRFQAESSAQTMQEQVAYA